MKSKSQPRPARADWTQTVKQEISTDVCVAPVVVAAVNLY